MTRHSDPNGTDCDTQFLLNITVHDCPADGNGIVCSGRGICAISNQTARPVCQCCDRYGGVTCQQEFPMVTCSDVTCFNGGTCIEANATHELPGSPSESIYNETATKATTCLCPIHVTGSRCEHVLTRCRANPCVHGICVDRAEGYQCYCVPGYHGVHCELAYNECLSSPCQNNGRCVDQLDAFECRCSHGHTGDRCEHKVDICTPNPCHMNATCTYLGDRIHCACPTGYTGATCSDVIGACHSSPCHNHATCIEHGEEYHCACPITFAGKHCEYMMDVFAPPMEESEIRGPGHRHNLYIVAGTLATMVAVVGAVLVACYCRIYETYKQLRWHRLKSTVSRSYSCPDFDGPAARKRHDKRRLSLDTGLLESASICYENAAYDSQAPNSLSVLQV
ncbi:delta-like protein D [Mya arenaria]|uniref:delta-like protein D n=1 Tax=Mya arenaria TaxID=6604 RepID=UPI0022E3C11D|nr:delta-like protein D [Mya arenaria]